MGQNAAKGTVAKFKKENPEFKDIIPELKDVTLKGVIPQKGELGRGAYGIVFKVKHGQAMYAAKKIHPILVDNVRSGEMETIKGDFIRECLCCSCIQHPNIVQFVGVYYDSAQSNLPMMVMELMDTSLAKFIENNEGQIIIRTKISILYDVSQGLNFLHSHKPQILHRDLSSNNVMLTRRQIVAKIGDLGVAKVVRADNRQTKSKLTIAPGTLHFMPPEALVDDNPVYGTPIDVFSFGGVAIHVFSEEWPTPSGQKMIDPVTEELVALSEAKRRQKYLDTMTGKAAVFRELVERCLSDNPKKRPPIQEVSTFIEPLKIKSMADEVKKVFEEFNVKLVQQLPLRDALFLAALTQQDLLSGNLKEEIRAASSQSAAAAKFLDQSIKPSLDISDTAAFDKLLFVMAMSDNQTLKKLAEKIKQKLSDRAINSTSETGISEVVPDRRKTSYSSLDETNVKRSSLTEPSTTDMVAAHKKETSMSLPEQWSKSKYLAAFSSLSQHNAIDKKASTENEIIVAQKQAVAKGTDVRDEKKATSPPEQSTTNGVTTDQEKTSSTQQCANKTHDTSAKKATSLPDQNVTGKNAIEQKKKEKKEKKQKKTKQKKELSPEKTTTSDAIPANKPTSFAEALQSSQYHIEWTSCSNLPSHLYNASVAVTPSGDQVYVTAWDAPDKTTENKVYCYNTKTDRWTVLPRSRHRRGTLCMIDGNLTIIGGDDPFTKEALNIVSTYNNSINSWYKRYPNMLCQRFKPGVVTYQNYVMVMGGKNGQGTTYNSIEIMDYRNLQLWTAVSAYLPIPMWNIKPTISGSHVTIVGYSAIERSNSCYQIAIENILAPISQSIFLASQWKKLLPTTWYETTIVPYSNPPVTIGGTSRTYLRSCVTSNITLYNPSTNLWKKVDSLASARDCVGVGLLSDNTIIVIGGTRGGEGVTEAKINSLNSVEIGTIVPNQK